MTTHDALPAAVLQRKAVVYVRQSTPQQVQSNLESQRRQYELVEVARRRGFTNIDVIDDDLGRTASGSVERPGFDRLVAALCAGQVGAVLCLEASRLARNGRDWHHLLELCGLVEARVIDLDGLYDPCRPNDRLLLGMKGSISEFELGIIRSRMYEAARSKAKRGELKISAPIGYAWDRHVGLGLDPDRRLQEVISQHSELRVRKPRTGEHGCSTPDQALAVMRSMAGRWSDQDIAASLNRMGMPSGQGKTWTAHRVGSVRRVRGIHGYRPAEKNGEWLTMRDAAAKLGVSHHQIRKLIKASVLASEQIMPDAPHQIRAADLVSERVVAALKRKDRPCRANSENQISTFSDT